MRESINFYYNLNISEIEDWGVIYRFKIKDIDFYFVPLKRTKEDLEDIVNIIQELKTKGIEAHDIILNKFGKIATNVYNEDYVLLKINGDSNLEYNLRMMLEVNNKLILNPNKSKLYRNSWANLWSSKIDYFEYQVHELGKDKQVILDSFSYYVGLGENAISYVYDTLRKYRPTEADKITLAHKRVCYPNYMLNYLNPLSFIFDLEVRDISEYIKSSFYSNEDALSYLKEVLKLKNFSIYSLSLLYARLLYPSFYFDIYEKVMNNEVPEEELIPIIDKARDYEIFLKNAYFEISKYAPITRVEWILKKEL